MITSHPLSKLMKKEIHMKEGRALNDFMLLAHTVRIRHSWFFAGSDQKKTAVVHQKYIIAEGRNFQVRETFFV